MGSYMTVLQMIPSHQHRTPYSTIMHLLSSGLALASLLSMVATGHPDTSDLTVHTTSGIVHGFINDTAPSVRQFLGVPYAEPPVKSLRFMPPQAIHSTGKEGVIEATAFAPSCMQQTSSGQTIYTELVPEFLIEGDQSEDCLYLNIWAPTAANSKNLPVFFYIPGGGFTSGGANSIYKIPDKWIERTQSHIVVVLNYRLNVFGFPNARGLEDLNVGLLDQRLAVEWTRNNIAQFGGDPSRITLWGQSAGAASVDIYAYAHYDNPLVSGLIADSGSASISIATGTDFVRSNFTFLASLVGCNETDAQKELDCMQNVPSNTLENALSGYVNNGTKPSISFTGIPDNVTIFSNTTDRALQGKIAKIPAIFGSNSNEGAGFVSWSAQGPGTAVLYELTEEIIACPSAKAIRDHILADLPVYRYYQSGNFSNISPVAWIGAYHSSELPLLFGTHDEYNGPSTPFEYQVSEAFEALWLSFASSPRQAPSLLTDSLQFTWPRFNLTSKEMVQWPYDDQILRVVSGDIIDSGCAAL